MKKLHISQLLVLLFAILVCISTVIPAAGIMGVNVNLLKPFGSFGSGVILMPLALLTIIFCLAGKRIPCLVFSILNLITAIFQYRSFGAYMEFALAGLYLMLAASILLFGAAVFMMIRLPKKEK